MCSSVCSCSTQMVRGEGRQKSIKDALMGGGYALIPYTFKYALTEIIRSTTQFGCLSVSLSVRDSVPVFCTSYDIS